MGKISTSKGEMGKNYTVSKSEEEESETAMGHDHRKLLVLWQGQTDHCNL